jgi:hypothetical protein
MIKSKTIDLGKSKKLVVTLNQVRIEIALEQQIQIASPLLNMMYHIITSQRKLKSRKISFKI